MNRSASPERPCDHALLYDRDCGFCRWTADRLLALDRRRRLRPVAIQSPEGDALLAGVPPERRLDSWHLVAPDGAVSSGGAGLPALARLLPAGRFPATILTRFPRLTERAYRLIADHRSGLSRRLPIDKTVEPRPC